MEPKRNERTDRTERRNLSARTGRTGSLGPPPGPGRPRRERQPDPPKRGALQILLWGIAGLCLLAAFVWFVHTMMAGKINKQERRVQVVQIIKPPPPPPPDQPPPPPPEKTEQALPKDEPEPAPDETPPPAEPLGLDAEGSAGGDAFGLAARHGGSDLVGGTGNAMFAWYTNRVKDAVAEKLGNDSCLTLKKFSASFRVWLEPDGRVKEAKLTTTTGNRGIDQCIQADLSSLSRMSDAPPLEMPQPINLKIVSHT